MDTTMRKMAVGIGFDVDWTEYDKVSKKMSDINRRKNKVKIDVDGKEEIDKAKNSTDNLTNANGKLGKSEQDVKKHTDATGKTILDTKTKYDRLKAAAKDYSDKSKRYADQSKHWDNASKRIDKVSRHARWLTAGISAGAVYGVKKSMDLEDSLKRTANLAVLGGEKQAEVQKNVNKMRSDGAKLSSKYGISQKEIADGYQELIKRGYSSNQAIGAQKSLVEASVATGDSYNDVVHNATTAVDSFGKRVKSTGGMIKNTNDSVNAMSYASDLTATDFHSMGKAMEYVGASAHQSGFSMHETASAIGELSNQGVEADKAGTGLRKVINSLQSPSKSATGALKSMGLSTEDFVKKNGKMKSMSDIFGTLNEHTKDMGKAEKATVFHALFGATGQNAGAILSSSAKGLKKLDNQVKNSAKDNYVQKLANKNMKSTKARWDQLKQSTNAVAITFGNAFLPFVNDGMQAVAHFSDKVNSLSDGTKKTIAIIGGFTAGVYPLLKIAKTVTGTVSSFKSLQSWFNGKKSSTILGIEKETAAYEEQNGILSENVALRKRMNGGYSTFDVNGVGSKTTTKPTTTRVEKYGTSSVSKGGLSKGAGLLNKAFTGLAWADMGMTVGKNAIGAFSSGLSSDKRTEAGWKSGGSLAGGAIGTVLGGPMGTMIGTQIGEAVGDITNKAIKPIHVKYDAVKGKNTKDKSFSESFLTSTGDFFSGKGSAYLDKDSGPSEKKKVKKNPYKDLPNQAQTSANKIQQIYKDMNDANVKNFGKSTSAIKKQNISSYSAIKKELSSYGKTSQTVSDKNMKLFEKEGGMSKSAANNAIKATKSNSSQQNKRVRDAEKAVNKIIATQKRGGKVTADEIKSANDKISKVYAGQYSKTNKNTKRFSNEQKVIYGNLKNTTGHVSKKTLETVLQNSKKQETGQISNANNTYKKSVSAANKKYKKVKEAADYERYVTGSISQKQYNSIVSKARKTKNDSVTHARTKKDKTISAAQTEHKKVVDQANKQAHGYVEQINFETGKAFTAWEKLDNAIKGLFGGSKPNKDNTVQTKNGKNFASKHTAADKTINKNYKDAIDSANTASNFKIPHFSSGTNNARNGKSLLGENGMELVQRGQHFYQVGKRGAEIFDLKNNDIVYNNHQVKSMMSGKYNKRLPNFATGKNNYSKSGHAGLTTSINTSSFDKFVRKANRTKLHPKIVIKNSNALKDLIPNKSIRSFNHSITGINHQLVSLRKNSNHVWDNISDKQAHAMSKISTTGTKKISSLNNSLSKNLSSIKSDWHKSWTTITSDFNNVFGKLDNYAHKGMKGAVTQLNSGISGIDKSLSQFGGKGNVLKPIHYATGTGPISHDQMAVLNDAKTGPRQETILSKEGHVRVPHGNNVVTKLNKGDSVLNGTDTLTAQRMGHLPHFAKGAGSKDALRKLIENNNKNSGKAFKNDFNNKIQINGSDLQKSLTTVGRQGSNKVGKPWYNETWNQMNGALNSSGPGGNWAHNPGSGWTNTSGFGNRGAVSGGESIHDGNDFSAADGSPFSAVHGGTVVRAGNAPGGWGPTGYSVVTKGDDGYYVIYQEFGTAKNAKVSKGDQVKTGQTIGTLGKNTVGTGEHVHIGVSKNYPFNNSGSTTKGWLDLTKITGKSNGNKKKQSGLSKLVSKQLKPQLSWISKKLSEDDFSTTGGTVPNSKHKSLLAKAGVPSSWFNAMNTIIQQESSWNPSARNGQYYGLPQTSISNLEKAGSDWRSNVTTQLKAMKSYISGRYGTADKALSFRNKHNWYAKGGRPNVGEYSIVGERGPELVKFDNPGEVINNKRSNQILSNLRNGSNNSSSKQQAPSKKKQSVSIKFGDIKVNIQGSGDSAKDGEKAAEKIMDKMFDKLNDHLAGGAFNVGN